MTFNIIAFRLIGEEERDTRAASERSPLHESTLAMKKLLCIGNYTV